MIQETLIKIALQESIKSCAKFLKEKKLKIDTTEKDIEEAIAAHTNQINIWSKEIIFSDLKKAKLTSQVFIDIDIYLMPKKTRISISEEIEKKSSKTIFDTIEKHCVILGQPGAGKTTLMKFLCQAVIFDELFYPEKFKFPILIRLRELNSKSIESEKNPIINFLFDTLGLVLKKEQSEQILKDEEILLAKQRILLPLIERLQPLIILDGYDEVSQEKMKDKVIEDFKYLVLNLTNSKIILTSRSSEYNYSIENTSVLEICPLNDIQIKSFASKWLVEKEKVDDFLNSLSTSPFVDTAIRPLTISHLCAIYERIGKIPDKPKTVYRKIINLLLEEWDEQRSVRRISKYGNFETDRKFEFLCRMAFEITIQYRHTLFNENELKKIYNKVYQDFSLVKSDSDEVLKEIESHTGLIIKSGYNDYEFAHKSIHEYLTAEHLVRLPSIPKNEKLLTLLANELAIAITISSSPSLYFCELVLNIFHPKSAGFNTNYFDSGFITTFVNRLVLEKPDFNHSSDISLALLGLYSLFKRVNSGQLSIFEIDLQIQLEKFVELIFKRNKKFDFRYFYEIDETYKPDSSDPDIKLKLKEKKAVFSNSIYVLPKFLYSKSSFITDFIK